MDTKTKTSAIVWAIDPLENEVKPHPALVSKLVKMAKLSNIDIQPVYLLGIPSTEPKKSENESGLARFIEDTEKMAEVYLRELGVINARKIKILLSESSSHGTKPSSHLHARKDKVEQLIKCAEDLNAPFIVVSSHGRTGVQRLVLGSFAEQLLLHAPCPVLFLTHESDTAFNETETSFKRVLFATDFSQTSRVGFEKFLTLAQAFKIEVTLFHMVTLPGAALDSGSGIPVVIPDDYFPSQVAWAKEEGARWLSLAQARDLHSHLIILDEGVALNIGEIILSIAQREKIGLVALTSVNGPLSSVVMGSVARDVFRRNRFPVWAYGPQSLHLTT